LEKKNVWVMLVSMRETLSLPPCPSNPLEFESNPVFNVLITYEDFETGKHAKRTYDFLVENLGRDCQMTNQMWKFDVLSIPKLREIAVRDATQADIVIISSHGLELPEQVGKWVESWLMEGTGALALVALFDRPEPAASGSVSVREYLAGVAKRGHMEFFAQPDEWPGSNSQAEAFRLNAGSGVGERTLSTLADVVHRDVVTPRWGLNE
jgi:hypothetical protein